MAENMTPCRPLRKSVKPKSTAAELQFARDKLLDGSVHQQINALIEQGLRVKHIECGRHWLMSEIPPLDYGGIIFRRNCASEAELRAARRVVVHWAGET